jgi:GNAT superfamily N-acetyltransferase
MAHEAFTLDRKPHLADAIRRLDAGSWPEFLHHGNLRHWDALFDAFAPFQVLLCEEGDRVVAAGHTVPIAWAGTVDDLPDTIDGLLVRGLQGRKDGTAPTALVAVSAMVVPDRRGQGLSPAILKAMKQVAARHGLPDLLAPVRPTWKARHPRMPFEDYVRWTQPDGSPYDPWIRVHWKLGARPLAVAPATVTVTGTVAEWERWTGMRFPESGLYDVEGALLPVRIDRSKDEGRYEDPGCWMQHPVRRGP